MNNQLSILYVGSALPDTQETLSIKGISLAGHYAELGIVEGLSSVNESIDVLSFRPYTYFPREKVLFRKGGRIPLSEHVTSRLIPLVNIYPIRNFVRYVYILFFAIKWSLLNTGRRRVILVFNWLFPNFIFMRLVSWVLKAKICPVVMDWLPMDCNRLSLVQRLTYPMWFRKMSVKFLSLSDALFPITENIVRDKFPNMPSLLIDGGITQVILSKLFPLRLKHSERFVLFFAGGISVINHVDILLGYMETCQNQDVEMWFAGKGDSLGDVLAATKKDGRIKYLGMLNADDLFRHYEMADVLISLRDTSDPRLRYYFPSKTLELLCVGKPFITSNSAHIKRDYGDYCKVIEHCSIESFRDAVGFFMGMTPEERLAYGRRARSFMLNNHTWKDQGRRMAEFLKEEFCCDE